MIQILIASVLTQLIMARRMPPPPEIIDLCDSPPPTYRTPATKRKAEVIVIEDDDDNNNNNDNDTCHRERAGPVPGRTLPVSSSGRPPQSAQLERPLVPAAAAERTESDVLYDECVAVVRSATGTDRDGELVLPLLVGPVPAVRSYVRQLRARTGSG